MQTSNRRVILAYFLWLLLALLTGYVAWMFHATIVSLVSLWVASPTYRPFGWTSESIQPFSRLSLFIIGSGTMVYALWLENRLQRAGREGALWQFVLRTSIGLLIILGVCLLLLRF